MKKHVENKRHTNPHQRLTSHSPIGATIPPRHHTIGPHRQPTISDNCSCTPPARKARLRVGREVRLVIRTSLPPSRFRDVLTPLERLQEMLPIWPSPGIAE